MDTNKRKLKASTSKSVSGSSNKKARVGNKGKSSKRACLANLPGNTIISSELAQNLCIPGFISSLKVLDWKQEASLVKSYFKYTVVPEDQPNQMMTVLNGALHKIIKAKDADIKLKNYSAALVRQFESSNSRNRFTKEYTKAYINFEVEEQEKQAEAQARVTSRILTTFQAKTHKDKMKKRLDDLFNEDSDDKQVK
jgi:hypothetical protein